MSCDTNKKWKGRKYRISVEQLTEAKGATGAIVETWSELTEIWAYVKWVSGSENEILTKETATTKVEFMIRKNRSINKEMRINFENNYYDIITVLELPGRQYMNIKTELRQ